MFSLVLLMIFSCSSAYAQSLEGGQVTPENGLWGDNFTFKVTYKDNENNLPAAGYPKVYIDNYPENMAEDDPFDDDVTDGKLYKYEWASKKENVGNHTFYFFVKDNLGENARLPENEGPNIGKRDVLLERCEVSNPNPNPGDNITFTGFLKTSDDNLNVVGENVVLYETLSENTVEVESDITDEDGSFTIRIKIPEEGIRVFKIKFLGSDYCNKTERKRLLYVNSLNKSFVFGVSAAALSILVLIALFFLSRGVAREHLLKPLLIAFAFGVLLQSIGLTGFIALLVAGGIAGYMFSRRTDKWTEHLRVGIMAGFLLLWVVGLVLFYFLVSPPGPLGLIQNSITQAELFKIMPTEILYLLVLYGLLTGIGSIIGGMFRGFLGSGK